MCSFLLIEWLFSPIAPQIDKSLILGHIVAFSIYSFIY